MANVITGHYILLDTFTSAIDIAKSLGVHDLRAFSIEHIEWRTPVTADDVAAVKGTFKTIANADVDMVIFGETCVTGNLSLIKYFNGARISNIKIDSNGVDSGSIAILLRKYRKEY